MRQRKGGGQEGPPKSWFVPEGNVLTHSGKVTTRGEKIPGVMGLTPDLTRKTSPAQKTSITIWSTVKRSDGPMTGVQVT